MGLYFGTDGIRGKYGEKITTSVAYKVGNSLARQCKLHKKIVIGRDTRKSGSLLTIAFACGVMSQGIDVVDVGIVPTPAVAYLTKEMGFDYGVVISASHNEAKYNGIKVFNSEGFKLNDEEEKVIEKGLLSTKDVGFDEVGRFIFKPQLVRKYKKRLINAFENFDGLKIVLDCANGASFRIAKELFVKKGAKVIALNKNNDGIDINENCGALYPQVISTAVKQYGADMGFAFDGDGDRIIACDENGKILDGDDILFAITKNQRKHKCFVGTSMTNHALEKELAKKGTTLIRAEVGDKNVTELMKVNGAMLGGEPCGHIINFEYSSTGDGVASAMQLASLVKRQNKPLSKICTLNHTPQALVNVEVADKQKVLGSALLQGEILRLRNEFANVGRVVVRASGTENKIRIMCEHKNKKTAENTAKEVENLIKNIE